MAEHLSPISIARRLHQSDLFCFTPSLLTDLLNLGQRQSYRLVERLRDAGLVDEVEKAKYLLLGLEPERVMSNSLFIASHLVAPAYVSYWSALHFYGFTEQVLYEMAWNPGALMEALERVCADWERDLEHLLPQFVPYEVAREGIASLLE